MVVVQCNLLVHLTFKEEEDEDSTFGQRLVEVQVSSPKVLRALLDTLAQGEKPVELAEDAELLRDDDFSDVEIRQVVALHGKVCKYPVVEARVMQILPFDLSKL